MLNERPIPEAALRDKSAMEMLRVWIAEKKLHCSMKIGMYREGMNMSEEKAWDDSGRYHSAHCERDGSNVWRRQAKHDKSS